MSRAARRALDRRADRAFARIRGTLLEADYGADWAVLTESDGRVGRLPAREVAYVLAALGLDGYYEIIESQRADHRATWIPILVIVDGWASVRWTEALPMCRGGAA